MVDLTIEVFCNMKKVPELETERLTLRGITEADTQVVVNLRSNPDVYKYFIAPHKITPQEHMTWYENSYLLNENRIDWMAFDKNANFVGIFGVKRDSQDSSEAEVSYILSPEQYKKGYSTEAVERLIQFCRDNWHCVFVTAEIHEDNIDSIHFVKKLGFAQKGKNGFFATFVREC